MRVLAALAKKSLGRVGENVAVQSFGVSENRCGCFGIEHGGSEPREGSIEVFAVEVDEPLVAMHRRAEQLREVLQEVLALLRHVRAENDDAKLLPLVG